MRKQSKLAAHGARRSITSRSAVRKKNADGAPTPRRRAGVKRAYLPAHERRQLIIAAAQQVFARTSLQGARTRELAKAAAVNQATLFEHFSSKEDLFVAAVVQPLLEAMRGMRDRADVYRKAASLQDLLVVARSSAQRHLETMMNVYPLLATALFSDPALGKKLYREQIVPMLKERGDVMRGVVKDDVDPELLALAAFGMFFAVAMDRAFQDKRDDPAVIAQRLTDLLAYGFVSERQR